VDLDLPQRSFAVTVRVFRPELADQLLHPRVDVGAIEGVDARFNKGDAVLDCLSAVKVAVAASELPCTAQHARNLVARTESKAFHCISSSLPAAKARRLFPRARMSACLSE
jgi:hypothetical protein